MRLGMGEVIGKKKLARNLFQASSSDFSFLRHLSTRNGSNDDGGGGNKPGAHRTSSMREPCNSHSTDMFGSIHMDNIRTRIRKSDNQIQLQPPQFRPILERQNFGRERKPIHLPPMQLREVFACSSPSYLLFCEG